MLRNFGDHAAEFIAVVRRMETKVKYPARGKIFGKAGVGEAVRAPWAANLALKRAVFFTQTVGVLDEASAHTRMGAWSEV